MNFVNNFFKLNIANTGFKPIHFTSSNAVKYNKTLATDVFEYNSSKEKKDKQAYSNAPKNINEVYTQLKISKEEQKILENSLYEKFPNKTIDELLSPYELKSSLVSIEQEYNEPLKNCFGMLGSDIGELVSDAIEAKPYENIINNNILFNGYKLSLYDISRLKPLIQNGDLGSISKFMENKNPKLFEQLGGENFYINNTKSQSYIENLNNCLDKISKNPTKKQSIGIINGYKKLIELEHPINPYYKNLQKNDISDLLKSNLITVESLEIAEALGYDFSNIIQKTSFLIPQPTSKYIKNDKNVGIEINLGYVTEKIKTNGYEDLTSHEIHALTDWLYNEYNSNNRFKKSIDENLTNRAEEIMPYVNAVAEQLNKNLPNNIVIDNHFAMRMIDRNYIHKLSESDHVINNLLDITEQDDIKNLKQGAQKEMEINLDDNSTIKIKVKKDNNKLLHLETII